MEQYLNYTTEDFLLDEGFLNWVQQPTEATNLQWQQWLEQHPEKAATVNEARKLLLSLEFSQAGFDENFYAQLKQRIDDTISHQQQQPTIVRRFPTWLKVAAAVLGIVTIAGLAYYFSQSSGQPLLVAVATKYGETKNILLPDSSEVVLNANSSIKYNKDFTEGAREVWLKGEGFFKVRHIEKTGELPQKFIVHNNHVDVEVLGTEFNVRGADSITSVLLTKGQVRLTAHATKEQLLMQPNDLVTYHKNLAQLQKQKVEPSTYISWMEHKYILNKASLNEITAYLQRYFGIAFINQNKKAAQQLYSGTIELQDTATVIRTLSVLLNTTVTKEDNHITIH